jgi:hypothetical protein
MSFSVPQGARPLPGPVRRGFPARPGPLIKSYAPTTGLQAGQPQGGPGSFIQSRAPTTGLQPRGQLQRGPGAASPALMALAQRLMGSGRPPSRPRFYG